MQTAVWILQVLLALAFLFSGARKLLNSYEDAVRRTAALADYSPQGVKIIGLLEVLGALGVILPAATGILPWLTPLAAVGLGLTMIAAAVGNYRHHLYRPIVANAVLLAMALVVVYERMAALPTG